MTDTPYSCPDPDYSVWNSRFADRVVKLKETSSLGTGVTTESDDTLTKTSNNYNGLGKLPSVLTS